MTLEELEKACDKAEEFAKNSRIEPAFTVQLFREVKGERARVAPGLMGKVLEWGNKNVPSIILLKTVDVRKFIAKARGE